MFLIGLEFGLHHRISKMEAGKGKTVFWLQNGTFLDGSVLSPKKVREKLWGCFDRGEDL